MECLIPRENFFKLNFSCLYSFVKFGPSGLLYFLFV